MNIELMNEVSGKEFQECLETGRLITYHQLQKRSLSLARFLRGPLGLKKGDTIGVILKNVPEYALIVLAGSAAGLKVTTINPLYSSGSKIIIASNFCLILFLCVSRRNKKTISQFRRKSNFHITRIMGHNFKQPQSNSKK